MAKKFTNPNMTRSSVDEYLEVGCGRCDRRGTPECSVQLYLSPLKFLRNIMLDSGLREEMKWGNPVYTLDGKNVIMLGAFQDYSFISFLKGALLQDADKLLDKVGENTQSARILKFIETKQVAELESVIKQYVQESIEIEKAGLKVPKKALEDYNYPEELTQKMSDFPDFKKAFEALTPGRQKGYLLHFSQAKQSKTREARIEKYMEAIFNGKGLHDR